MTELNFFIPITKIDQAKRLVYGIATEEIEDSSGETCHYETTKPLYEKWSETMEKDTGGKSLGNLRAMHGPIAAGKVTQINFNDAAKQIEICAKVVDDAEWLKVQEGVYSGFSQGGSYVKRWKDPDTGVQYYTADPIEISLVDRPCLPTATFSMIKSDGTTELRKFNVPAPKEQPSMPTNSEVAAKAVELANLANDKNWTAYIEPARKSFETSMEIQAAPINEKSAQDHSDALIDETLKVEEDAAGGTIGTKKPRVVPDPKAGITVGADAAGKSLSPNNGEHGEQVWKSNRDGSLFAKKADMVAYNEKFDAAQAVAEITGGAESLLTELAEQIGKRKNPTEDSASPAKKDQIETAQDICKAILASTDRAIITERAKALGLTDQLPKHWEGSTKKATFAELMKLEKGLPTCSRLACLIEELHTVKHATWMEAKQENDGSPIPMMLHQNIDDLCTTLKIMVEEETAELLQGQDVDDLENAEWAAMFQNFVELPDNVYGLVKQFLPRNMSDNLIASRTVAKMEKAKIEAEQLAKAKAEVTIPEELSKELSAARATNEALTKKVNSMQEVLAELVKGVKDIAEQPVPVPMRGTFPAEKDAQSMEQESIQQAYFKRLNEDKEFAAVEAFKHAKRFAPVDGFTR